MSDWLSAAKARMDAGREAVLLTVIEARGSTPRGAGARMLVDASGLWGTIGGGKMEYEALKRAQALLAARASALAEYSLTGKNAADLGVCGGTVRVAFQFIAPGNAAFRQMLEGALDAQGKDENAWLAIDLNTFEPCLSSSPIEPGDTRYVEQILNRATVYVLGCGHVARELIKLLDQADFRVAALDDRADFADPALLPGARAVRLVDFEDPSLLERVTSDDYIAIMTRGHEHDLRVLMSSLETPARYIGMMGSRKKRASVYQSVLKKGFTEQDLRRVRSPIGLEILAETPFEIALSIASELVRERALGGQLKQKDQ